MYQVNEIIKGVPTDLGLEVEDILTGFKGKINAITYFFGGTIQASVYPRSPDGEKVPDGHSIDVSQLKYLSDGIKDVAKPMRECDIELGSKVKDKFSGFKGHVLRKIVYLNGCVYFEVVPEHNESILINEVPKASFIDSNRLETIKAKKIVDPVDVAPKSSPRPGGPMSVARRM